MITQRSPRPASRPAPDHLGLPPPVALDLTDMNQHVGWVKGDAIGFRGFAGEVEATHAAWVAYRTLARRLARRDGRRPIPIDTEPLTLQRRGDHEVILASGRTVGTLVRPGPRSPSGPDTFGFEVRVPAPADEGAMRAKALLMYRTLRRAGIRWGMWSRGARQAAPRPPALEPPALEPLPRDVPRAASESGPRATRRPDLAARRGETAQHPGHAARHRREEGRLGAVVLRGREASSSTLRLVAQCILAGSAVVVAASLLRVAPRTVTAPLLVALVSALGAAALAVAIAPRCAARRQRRARPTRAAPPRGSAQQAGPAAAHLRGATKHRAATPVPGGAPPGAAAAAAAAAAEQGRTESARGGTSSAWSADAVHDALADSFPASDPPSWTPLRLGSPAARERRP